MLAVIDVTAEKQCSVCGEVLPLSSFAPRKKGSRDGHISECRECHLRRDRERAEERRQELAHNDGCVSPDNPYIFLARAVIVHALRDWKRHGCPRGDLIRFFRSRDFDNWADLAGLNPEVIRERLGICS